MVDRGLKVLENLVNILPMFVFNKVMNLLRWLNPVPDALYCIQCGPLLVRSVSNAAYNFAVDFHDLSSRVIEIGLYRASPSEVSVFGF
ncbi:hypothetical protein Tco_0554752 [Tanacetum coccineum]